MKKIIIVMLTLYGSTMCMDHTKHTYQTLYYSIKLAQDLEKQKKELRIKNSFMEAFFNGNFEFMKLPFFSFPDYKEELTITYNYNFERGCELIRSMLLRACNKSGVETLIRLPLDLQNLTEEQVFEINFKRFQDFLSVEKTTNENFIPLHDLSLKHEEIIKGFYKKSQPHITNAYFFTEPPLKQQTVFEYLLLECY